MIVLDLEDDIDLILLDSHGQGDPVLLDEHGQAASQLSARNKSGVRSSLSRQDVTHRGHDAIRLVSAVFGLAGALVWCFVPIVLLVISEKCLVYTTASLMSGSG